MISLIRKIKNVYLNVNMVFVDLRSDNMIPQPNCSEAIYRIRIDNLTKEEIEKVEEIIEKLEKLEQDEWNVNDGTWWRRVTIFGINIIEIRGQYPHDRSSILDALFKSLPFGDKIKTEVDFDV